METGAVIMLVFGGTLLFGGLTVLITLAARAERRARG